MSSTSSSTRCFSRAPLILAGGLLAGLLTGCTDSVTCVFTTGCQGGGAGALSDNAAARPFDGDLIVDGPPAVDGFFPEGTQNAGTTPIVLIFSESIQEASLDGAIQVIPLLGGGLAGDPLPGLQQALVADGRVLVILPPTGVDLPAGDYIVRLATDAAVLDLTGQQLALGTSAQVGNFTVSTSPPTAPAVVAIFPDSAAINQSPTTQVVTVFDRPMDLQSIDDLSFEILVDGTAPLFDPDPEPIMLSVGAVVLPDSRALLYRSVGLTGQPVPLGLDVAVELNLSPTMNPITSADGENLPAETVRFQTNAIAAPLGASLLSVPFDAIGLANLTAGDPEELMLEVELDGLEPNDTVDLIMVGTSKSPEPEPPLAALQRSLLLTGTAPIQSVIFTREDIGLQLSEAPDDVFFADGALTLAFRVRRGAVVTPLRILDLEPDPATVQDPLLDTSVPVISSFVGSPDTDTFRSEQRGFSLAGDAGERLRAVEVSTPLGGNGTLPPVIGSMDEGLFLAAPVPLEIVVGGETTFSAVARDGAQNGGMTVKGTYTQLGSLGDTAFTPGSAIEVAVYDSRTLEDLPGALVLVHSDDGNGVDYPFFQVGMTLADGTIGLATPGAPSVGAIVTVVLPGYDLFTFHGIVTTRLSVPLAQSNLARSRAGGQLFTSNAAAVALLPALDRRYDDSRRAVELPRGFIGLGCAGLSTLACIYGPASIEDNLLGARSFVAGDFSQPNEAGFAASQLVQGFSLALPFAPVASNALQSGDLDLPFLLIDPTAPAEEAAQALPAFTFRVDAGSGVDLLTLVDDPTMVTTGTPFVSVDALVPGLPGSIGVGLGLSYIQGAGLWTVRAAIPGAVTPTGSLGVIGAVDTDLLVRVEVIDLNGNAAGVRPRLSTIEAGGPNPEFRALAVPTQLDPAPAASTGGQAFNLRLMHTIDDARSENGLYRVELEDGMGRCWVLWRPDGTGTADVQVRAVDVQDAGAGVIGLADGTLTTRTSAWAWEGIDPTDFLWSDLERQFELFSRAEAFTFTKP